MTNRKIIAVSIEPRKLEQLDHYAAMLCVSRSKAIALLIGAGTPPLQDNSTNVYMSVASNDPDTLESLKAWAAHNGWREKTNDEN